MRWFRVRMVIPLGSIAWTADETDRVLGHLSGLKVESIDENLTFLFDVEIPGWATKDLLGYSGIFEAIANDHVIRAFLSADKAPPLGKITVEKFYEDGDPPLVN